jgi:glutamyl-tRNA synthetase/glutamyl-Q tRNA(Asp) synthetase
MCSIPEAVQPMRTRFAPAPTGYLHLGHVANAIHVWGLARLRDGEVLLRIEDHDRQRCRRAFERALLDDLDWLGFRPDIHSTDVFRRGSCDGRQSDRDHVYHAALAPLVERGLVYACDCSRRQLESPAYPGTCRNRRLPLNDGLGWRLRLDEGDETFVDGRLGSLRQRPAEQCGDLLVRDRHGNWTYQWSVVTDDVHQGITCVVRGEDLLESTGRQISVARLLGRLTPPSCLHHPLVMKSPTEKLSKSDGGTGIRELREGGWTPAQVIGLAASRVGLQRDPVPVTADDVCRFFDGDI